MPGLKIDGEIGQQLGYLNAANAGALNFVVLVIIGWAFAHKAAGHARLVARSRCAEPAAARQAEVALARVRRAGPRRQPGRGPRLHPARDVHDVRRARCAAGTRSRPPTGRRCGR